MKKSTPALIAMIVVVAYTLVEAYFQGNRAWEVATSAQQQTTMQLSRVAALLDGLLVLIFFAAIYIKKTLEANAEEGNVDDKEKDDTEVV